MEPALADLRDMMAQQHHSTTSMTALLPLVELMLTQAAQATGFHGVPAGGGLVGAAQACATVAQARQEVSSGLRMICALGMGRHELSELANLPDIDSSPSGTGSLPLQTIARMSHAMPELYQQLPIASAVRSLQASAADVAAAALSAGTGAAATQSVRRVYAVASVLGVTPPTDASLGDDAHMADAVTRMYTSSLSAAGSVLRAADRDVMVMLGQSPQAQSLYSQFGNLARDADDQEASSEHQLNQALRVLESTLDQCLEFAQRRPDALPLYERLRSETATIRARVVARAASRGANTRHEASLQALSTLAATAHRRVVKQRATIASLEASVA
jgi:hypothetical protein